VARSTREGPAQAFDYALALSIVIAAVIFRIGLDELVPGRFILASFLPAVLLAAYFCGLGPSLAALVLASAAASIWIAPPPDANPAIFYGVGFSLCVAVGALMAYLVHGLRVASERSRQHEEQLALINRELKHRIKNLFSIAGAICQQTMKSGASPDQMSKAVAGRLSAVANAQDLLSVTSRDGAGLIELIEALVRTVAPDASKLRVSGGPVTLPAEATTPFALILHELATNALKYGAWSHNGLVAVTWKVENGDLRFEWREHDGPAVAPPVREGLGSALIKTGLPSATVQHDIKPDGLQCRICLPLGDEARDLAVGRAPPAFNTTQ
jgi:two-component sensor histidine kinase